MIDTMKSTGYDNFFSMRNPQLEAVSMLGLEMAVVRWSMGDGEQEQHLDGQSGLQLSKERA